MWYEWDEAKRIQTLIKRGVDFAEAGHFQWDTAQVVADDRGSYGESRLVATGFIGKRLYVMAFTIRGGVVRIISLRKANAREVKDYEKATD